MADLIDRTEFIALMERGYCEPCKDEKLDRNGVCCRVYWVNDAISEIDRMPTIDPESLRPVGRWLADGSCSNCGEFDNRDPYGSNFCQHCGAKMEV